MDCTISDDKYNEEIKRLSSIAEYNGKDFEYPAYVVQNKKGLNEYVLCQKEDRRLVYKFAQYPKVGMRSVLILYMR